MQESESARHDTAKVIAERLEVARRELLDLGMRNPLLNYRLLRARGLEIVDEIPAQVFRLLVQEARAMAFFPRMDEEEDELTAQPQEITATETPAERHTDRRLQTDVSSDEVQSRLLATYYAANSFVQEQGVNILYLALGMLTWYEADSSKEPRRAPLLLVPVELTRSNVRERFRLSYTGEEPGENLSLIEKAKSDFRIDMPSLPDIEIESGDIDVDGYLQRVEEAVKEMPRWSVDKNSIVLGLFSFSKFLMFRDLDVETWPEDEQPSAHPIISALLDQGFSEPEPRLDADDDLDERLRPLTVRHVLDADGSQTLAIVDVDQGRNLVVQGPPGTGKSQTIANRIAQAIGQKRTVLFVSEKMADLEVVKRRLDSVGLGAACLELHSNKSTKTAVLDELKRTLDWAVPAWETWRATWAP